MTGDGGNVGSEGVQVIATAGHVRPAMAAAVEGDPAESGVHEIGDLASRIADDHHRPAWQLAGAARILLWEGTEHADHLASALNSAANLTATLHAAAPAT
jgi:hypothetical protein